jgi:hypothetical protein
MKFRTLTPQEHADRFWQKVDRSGGPDACWPWLGTCYLRGGYGELKRNGKKLRAHRVAYELIKGLLTNNALHTCDNPKCCNPAHLYDGTQINNIDDMTRRGRSRLGTNRNPPRGAAHWSRRQPEKVRRGAEVTAVAARKRKAGAAKLRLPVLSSTGSA